MQKRIIPPIVQGQAKLYDGTSDDISLDEAERIHF